MPNTPQEWYQQGQWPLIGAIATLAITNLITLHNIFLQSRLSLNLQIKIKTIDYISQQLTEFYNPLHSLLLINQKVFTEVGPHSFPQDPVYREGAARIWNEAKERVIIINNQKIQAIIKEKSHLISNSDNINNYLGLQNHITMYEIFQNFRSELYSKFTFPEGIVEHLQQKRDELVKNLNTLKELKNGVK